MMHVQYHHHHTHRIIIYYTANTIHTHRVVPTTPAAAAADMGHIYTDSTSDTDRKRNPRRTDTRRQFPHEQE